jgi:hypothetical protein
MPLILFFFPFFCFFTSAVFFMVTCVGPLFKTCIECVDLLLLFRMLFVSNGEFAPSFSDVSQLCVQASHVLYRVSALKCYDFGTILKIGK